MTYRARCTGRRTTLRRRRFGRVVVLEPTTYEVAWTRLSRWFPGEYRAEVLSIGDRIREAMADLRHPPEYIFRDDTTKEAG